MGGAGPGDFPKLSPSSDPMLVTLGNCWITISLAVAVVVLLQTLCFLACFLGVFLPILLFWGSKGRGMTLNRCLSHHPFPYQSYLCSSLESSEWFGVAIIAVQTVVDTDAVFLPAFPPSCFCDAPLIFLLLWCAYVCCIL